MFFPFSCCSANIALFTYSLQPLTIRNIQSIAAFIPFVRPDDKWGNGHHFLPQVSKYHRPPETAWQRSQLELEEGAQEVKSSNPITMHMVIPIIFFWHASRFNARLEHGLLDQRVRGVCAGLG